MGQEHHMSYSQDLQRMLAERELAETKRELDEVKRKLAEVNNKHKALLLEKKEWDREKASLKDQINQAAKTATDHAKYMLGKWFSPLQVKSLLTGKLGKHWCKEDVIFAVAIRTASPKAYNVLREKWQFAFPSVHSLQRWTSELS